MYQSTEDITELAEAIGLKYFASKVNLEKIAEDNGIQILKIPYDNAFSAYLVYRKEKYYIILNENTLNKIELGRVRFTIAHELGHYFIDGQRKKISRAIVLTDEEESAADHFAAFLLMPSSIFIQEAQKFEPGVSSIVSLKIFFGTSIVATLRHYVELNIRPCIMIRWDHEVNYRYHDVSLKLTEINGFNKHNLKLKFQRGYLEHIQQVIKSEHLDFYETATYLAKWVLLDSDEMENNLLGIEQTITIGEFGGITLLIF